MTARMSLSKFVGDGDRLLTEFGITTIQEQFELVKFYYLHDMFIMQCSVTYDNEMATTEQHFALYFRNRTADERIVADVSLGKVF